MDVYHHMQGVEYFCAYLNANAVFVICLDKLHFKYFFGAFFKSFFPKFNIIPPVLPIADLLYFFYTNYNLGRLLFSVSFFQLIIYTLFSIMNLNIQTTYLYQYNLNIVN